MPDSERDIGKNACLITLGDDFQAVVIDTQAGRVMVDAQGNINVLPRNINHAALTEPEVSSVSGGENKSAAKAQPEIGALMKDGTIYAGISPLTGEDMFVTAKDAPLTMTWRRAMEYVAETTMHGHRDWRLPSRAELDVLYQNRNNGNLSGTFKKGGFFQGGCYWSSSEEPNGFKARYQKFNNGQEGLYAKFYLLSVRCIRRQPRPDTTG